MPVCADGGGSGYRVRAWKIELAKLAAETGLEITVCHLPPGTSKWNRIEHRLFSQIPMNWRGRPLRTHQIIVDLIGNTQRSRRDGWFEVIAGKAVPARGAGQLLRLRADLRHQAQAPAKRLDAMTTAETAAVLTEEREADMAVGATGSDPVGAAAGELAAAGRPIESLSLTPTRVVGLDACVRRPVPDPGRHSRDQGRRSGSKGWNPRCRTPALPCTLFVKHCTIQDDFRR